MISRKISSVIAVIIIVFLFACFRLARIDFPNRGCAIAYGTESLTDTKLEYQDNEMSTDISPKSPKDFPAPTLSEYDKWVSETLEESKEAERNAIIVVKTTYRLYLIKDGLVNSRMPVELGFNPSDNKRMEGDGCTPEGFYKVTEKRDIGMTKFYRGFMLDYPNARDKENFESLKRTGAIPIDSTIGGLIMIHGKGSGRDPESGGTNWTLGCVALSDHDMDRLFSKVDVGTPVTIVKETSLM